MKRLILTLMLLSACGCVSCVVAAVSPQREEVQRRSFLRGDVLEIDLREAGKLNEYLGPGEDRQVRCIRLSGVMNGDDAKFIKKRRRHDHMLDTILSLTQTSNPLFTAFHTFETTLNIIL